MTLKNIMLVMILIGISFYAGIIWNKNELLNSGAFKLNRPISIQADPSYIGTLQKIQ